MSSGSCTLSLVVGGCSSVVSTVDLSGVSFGKCVGRSSRKSIVEDSYVVE